MNLNPHGKVAFWVFVFVFIYGCIDLYNSINMVCKNVTVTALGQCDGSYCSVKYSDGTFGTHQYPKSIGQEVKLCDGSNLKGGTQ